MRLLFDFFILNLSMLAAFVLREAWGHFPNQPPSFFAVKYLLVLFFLNLLYLFIFWMVGAYDRRQKRALLEEFILIFGVISTGLFVLITFLFMGQMWWMSRGILYMFGFLSIFSLCLFRIVAKTSGESKDARGFYNLGEIRTKLKEESEKIFPRAVTLTVVIVGYNSQKTLEKCLASLEEERKTTSFEVVFVDNNSSDCSISIIKNKFPWVKLIANKGNIGYTKAVNQGLNAAMSEYYLILNPDIIVLSGSIRVMLDYMQRNHKVGISGCKLLNEDGSLQYSVRRFLDLRTYLYRFTPIRELMVGSALEKYFLMQDWDHGDDRLVDWVLGGCMLVRKEAVDQVGMMDEKIFLYFDDVDWCYRMWEKGWQVAYVAEAAMVHKHMRSSMNKLFNRATFEHFKSLFYFMRKHGFGLPRGAPSSLE